MLTLKKSNDFQTTLKSGKWYGTDLLVVYINKNNENINRVGIAVGKKVAKSVKRNRIRRVIREAYRLNEKNILNGYDIVIMWKNKNSLDDVSLSSIEKCLNSAFSREGIIIKQ